MPWKASSVMEERLRFVARLLDGEAMTDVCRDLRGADQSAIHLFVLDFYRQQIPAKTRGGQTWIRL